MALLISVDLRERVLADPDEWRSKASLVRKDRVSICGIYKLQTQCEATGGIASRKGGGGPRPKLTDRTEQLLKLVEEQPDASPAKLRDWLVVCPCRSARAGKRSERWEVWPAGRELRGGQVPQGVGRSVMVIVFLPSRTQGAVLPRHRTDHHAA